MQEYLQLNRYTPLISGILLCSLLTIIAKFGGTALHLPIMLCCLGLGFLGHPFTQKMPQFNAGVGFSAKFILRLGVILLGARFAFADLSGLGGVTILLIIAATLATIFISLAAAKMLKLSHNLGLLLGGATAICGASASLAIAALLPQNKETDEQTAAAVIAVTAIGTLAMILYPFILPLLPFTDQQAALFIGGTIHDVAQVVGAGYSLSHDIGDGAILVKLIRVFMLIPVLVVLSLLIRHDHSAGAGTKPRFQFPLFLIGFIALLGLNAMGLIPDALRSSLKDASSWALMIALTAVGLKTPIGKIFIQARKPFILVLINSFALIALYAAYIFLVA